MDKEVFPMAPDDAHMLDLPDDPFAPGTPPRHMIFPQADGIVVLPIVERPGRLLRQGDDLWLLELVCRGGQQLGLYVSEHALWGLAHLLRTRVDTPAPHPAPPP